MSCRWKIADWTRWVRVGLKLSPSLLTLLPMVSPIVRAEEVIVELPPMIVNETAKTPPWLYVRVGVFECLSRCTDATTREFLVAQDRQFQLLRLLVPDRFWVRLDNPFLVVLDRLELRAGDRDAVAQDILTERAGSGRPASEAKPLNLERIRYLPNIRIDDTDESALFAYLDEKNYDGATMTLKPGYVRFLLERRTPMLPVWLIEGIIGTYEEASFTRDPISLAPTAWIRSEARALLRDPEWPRALLPMEEFFSARALLGPDGNPRRQAIYRAQAALFFRWAIDPRHAGMRDAYWKLGALAAEGPITEEKFEACFGFGYTDMRDRLSDYLAAAVKEPLRIKPGTLTRPSFEARRATPPQIARLRGEWERMVIGYVRIRHPQSVSRYVDQARRTLRLAFDEGDRDPRLLASLGLCEVDAGNDLGAPFFLEKAIAAEAVRPRAYFELARIRFADLTRNEAATRQFTAAELRPVVELLRTGLAQEPPMSESYSLLANSWLRSSEVPPVTDFALLEKGTELFMWHSALAYRVAVLFARHERRAGARAVIARALPCVVDEKARAVFLNLAATLR